jgi:hypothetical protein
MGRYVTAGQMAAVLGLDDSANLDALDFFIRSAEAAVDRETGRRFDAVTETRQFDVTDPGGYLRVGDLVSVTAVGVADATGDAFTTLAVSDYFLGPANRGRGVPYQVITLSDVGSYSYAYGHRTVEITGVWGWESVPDDIADVTMKLAVRNYHQGRAGGVSRITDIPGLGTVEFSATESATTGGFTAAEWRILRGRGKLVVA